MGKDDGKSLTSVKLPDILMDDFRIFAIKNKINIQKLIERSMYLYCTDNEFRRKINNTIETFYTGSAQ